MYMNMPKLMFFILLIFSSLIAISSNSWMMSWISLEMNLFFFMPLIKTKTNLMNSEFIMKYFIIQTISSANLLTMMILTHHLSSFTYLFLINIIFTLLLKLGSAPFHFWFIQIIENLSWTNFFLISTWQKLAPFILLSYFMNSMFIYIFTSFNCILGTLSGINQLYLRKLLAFSSINAIGWMLSTLLVSETLWAGFFFFYSIMLLPLTIIFNLLNLTNMNQLLTHSPYPFFNLSILFNFLSMGGLPPMIGFMPKWMVIFNISFLHTPMLIILISTSLINLFFYFRLMYPLFTLNMISLKWGIFTPLSNYYIIPFMMFFPIISMFTGTLMFYIF
uniref:NADH-ubiquinone oxidoreductase chain 2 n=1 Tax=Parapsyche difformis TaxID=2904886 RepID=A0A9E8LNK3_9NEOP|nr:NADH dehydrogenase subunit 2 [Parapsyche difformis]UZZ43675.1 NADH dehydrogenase subunit 2 [Parapsyche difformis]